MMRLLEFIEHHRGEQMIVDRKGLSLLVVLHQIRIDLRHLLGNQPILHRMASVRSRLFVAERNGAQVHQSFAPIAYRMNVILEALRRGQRSQLPVRINEDRDTSTGGDAVDTRDEGRLMRAGSSDANNPVIRRGSDISDGDVVVSGRQVLTGAIAESDVVAAGG